MTKVENLNEMLQVRRDKLDQLIAAGMDPHIQEHFNDRSFSASILSDYASYEGKTVRVAGRIMTSRGHGKVIFMDLQDAKGRIQLFNRMNDVGEELFETIRKLDIGDIVGVTGEVFTTKTGEISVRTKELTLLTKSLQLLPEKFHGLVDPDLRYRQRYVDLIVNPEVKQVFITRSKIITAIRSFMESEGFLEVETPILSTIAGGAAARPFITHHNTLDIDMYLRIANELYLKRLIVGGFDKVYEIGPMFRNEGMDATHNPEYTAMELYAAYTDYEYMMWITENLSHYIATHAVGRSVVPFGGEEIDYTPPWKRMRMTDAVKEYAGIDFETIQTDEEARALAKEKGIKLNPGQDTRGHIITEFFEEFCEDHLVQPTFITHHPVEVSPLSKRDPEDGRYTHRFEGFVCGKEICNGYSELNDARDQRGRFEEQVKARAAGDAEAHMMDYDFLNALEVGLPPTGGLGIGVDRLIMFMTGQESIRDVLLFPTMKPIGSERAVEGAAKGMPEAAQDQIAASLEGVDLSNLQIEPLFEDMVDFETFSKSDFRVVKVINCEEVPKSKQLLKFTLDDGSGRERVILSGIKQYYTAEELVGKTLLAITNLPPKKMMGIASEGMIISAIHHEEDIEKLNLIILDNGIPAGAKLY